jgi:hypothetical protein
MTEVVDEFVCIGTCIAKHRGELKDIRRIGLASDAYHSLFTMMKSRVVHRQT